MNWTIGLPAWPAPIPQTEEGITKVEWKTQTEINDEVLPNTFKNIKLILSEVFAI